MPEIQSTNFVHDQERHSPDVEADAPTLEGPEA